MRSTKRELLEALEKIASIRALVVGDLILDRYIWGDVSRISPEAPVPIVDVKRLEDRLGGAGNAARNLLSIGASVSMCGFIGDDKEGEILLELLERDGATRDAVIVDREHPTSLKTRIIGQGQQMLRIDRESSSAPGSALREGFAAIVDAHLDSSQVIVLSDYGKGCISECLIRRLQESRRQGRVGMSVRPLVVDPHPNSYGFYDEICVAKPNRREAEAATGIKITNVESAERAARALIDRWKASMMVITLGEDGLVIVERDVPGCLAIETVAQEVFDVSGAGDTVTALFAAAIAAGVKPSVAGDLANIGAGIVVSEVGTVAVKKEQLLSEIRRLGSAS